MLLEPLSALLGAWKAPFDPSDYLLMTVFPSVASSPTSRSVPAVDVPTTVAMSQLANMYLLFAIGEALVLRSTSDLHVWRVFLFGLLVADIGHLLALRPLGHAVYWNVLEWNAMAIGNVGFVYVGALTRLCFLSGIGITPSKRSD